MSRPLLVGHPLGFKHFETALCKDTCSEDEGPYLKSNCLASSCVQSHAHDSRHVVLEALRPCDLPS